ncbi:MAG: hypothetical protein WAK55_09885 [Xanthobacteraceae bacterium]
MRRTALVGVGVAVAAVASVAAYMESASGQSNGDAAPIHGVKIPAGYRDWRVISVKRLTGKQLTGTGKELKQLRAELGNDLAIKAYRDGTLPFRMVQSLPRCIGMKTRRIQTTKSWPRVFPASASKLLLPGPP